MMEPVGGYKGTGLALVLGLLAGTLNGAAFGAEIPDFALPDSGFGVNTGQFIVVLDVARFMPLDAFISAVDRQLQKEGRLRLIESVEDVRTKIVLQRRQKNGQKISDERPALQAIVDGIGDITK